MANPVLVEVTRGNIVESRHRGSVAVMDADGALVLSLGDIDQFVFPRSAVKSIQALPFVESGAADAYGFGDREIALSCASHSGQAEHAALAASMLHRAGLDHTALECGAHWPMQQAAALELARSGGQPSALHNNCSGKHSGFVCTCHHLGINYRGYVSAEHESQKMVKDAMESITGVAHAIHACGTDGCSIPTYAVPLKSFAQGFARMATGTGLAPERARAARRIFAACMAEPFFVAGTERLDTDLMTAAKGRVMIKVGAEGVYCGAIPELGLGIAIKADDGAGRACETMVAAVLAKLLARDSELAATLRKMANPVLRNWNGIEIGSVRATDALN
jgi:L-asparaginase II